MKYAYCIKYVLAGFAARVMAKKRDYRSKKLIYIVEIFWV